MNCPPPAPWSPSPIPRDLNVSFSAAVIASPAKPRPAGPFTFVTEGAVATVDGRLGTVVAQENEAWVRMRYADDGSETLDWISVERLANVVACSDHHQGGLADSSVALPRGMTPRTAAFTAAPPRLASINALGCPLLGDDGLATLVSALRGTLVQ